MSTAAANEASGFVVGSKTGVAEQSAHGRPGRHVFRRELVARVRAEIRAGAYDSMEKVEACLDRLMADLA